MTFQYPEVLLLLFLIPLIYLFRRRIVVVNAIHYADAKRFAKLETSRTRFWVWLTRVLRIVAICLMILALSRPQLVSSRSINYTNGIDIMIALDISDSMRAEDFSPNRLESAKETVKAFINKRPADRIGLVVFGRDAYTQFPLTLDHDVLDEFVENVRIGGAGDGTSIGMAIATALNRLKHSEATSKIVVLITDGENNVGAITPESAAKLASEMGIKVYTIGVGKEGGAPIPIDDPERGRIYARDSAGRRLLTYLDEATLKQISAITDARFFRATNARDLESIYDEINSLEPSDLTAKHYVRYRDYFVPLMMVALMMMIVEFLVAHVIMMRVP